MSERALHRDEVVAGAGTVRQLVDTQFPAGRSLPLRRLRTDGTDNVMYRLGAELLVRLPRRPGAASSLETELRWLPELAPALPVPVPAPVFAGDPGGGYPWPWAIYRWLPGEEAASAVLDDQRRFAHELAGFVGALHSIDVAAVAEPDRPHWYRCDPIFGRDRHTRDNLRRCRQLDGLDLDLDLVEQIWDEAMSLPPTRETPRWVHTDLTPFNLLVSGGRLSAVIDFGGLAVGDPVIDLIAPWGMLSATGRSAFRGALGVDEVRWRHARAWVLALAVGVLPYYWRALPSFVAHGLRQLREVIDDYRQEGS